jgi:3-dehydroquinate synthase
MDPVQIDVRSERGVYPVLIGAGLLSRLPDYLASHKLTGDTLVVSCPPVWRAQGRRMKGVAKGGAAMIPDGEKAKSLRTVAGIYDALVRRRIDRSGTLIAFGGGVVGDVAGFAAASYLRGIKLVQVPTTLLAQVDSSVGGKVGVNLPVGKNLVGAFYPARLVLCDPLVLSSLPRREFRAGMYEVVKYGVIRSRPLFDRLTVESSAIFAHDPLVLTRLVADCCQIKADVVGEDERESGPRRILNFGHTIGHALESITRYRRFLHGEAIAYGMRAAARLSVLRGTMTSADEARLSDLLVSMGPLPPVADLRAADALRVVQRDKKVVAGRLHFVLAKGLGDTEIVGDVTQKELTQAMTAIGMRK